MESRVFVEFIYGLRFKTNSKVAFLGKSWENSVAYVIGYLFFWLEHACISMDISCQEIGKHHGKHHAQTSS